MAGLGYTFLISGLADMSDDPAGSLGSLMRGQLQVAPKQQEGKPPAASGFQASAYVMFTNSDPSGTGSPKCK